MSGDDSVQALFSSSYGWQAHMLLNWSSPSGDSPDILISGDKGTLQLWPGRSYVELYPAEPQLLTTMVSMIRPAWLSEKLMSRSLQQVRLPIPARDRIGYLNEVREFLAAVAERRQPGDNRRGRKARPGIVLRSLAQNETWVSIPPAPPAI